MLISGLLITLSNNTTLAGQAVALLRARPDVTLGERATRWLPVATEAPDDAQCRDLHDWIAAQPGVEFVDVVAVGFENPEAVPIP